MCDDGYREHFRLHGCDLLPTALLLVFAADRSIAAADVLTQLVGHSPASLGEEAPPPWRLVTGYDLDSLAAAELPPVPQRPKREPVAVPDEQVLLDRVDAAERDELARLLADARATYGVRDDTGCSPRRGRSVSCVGRCSKPDAVSSATPISASKPPSTSSWPASGGAVAVGGDHRHAGG